jgi:hypothetical protein
MTSVLAGITRSPRVLTADVLLFVFFFKPKGVPRLVRFGSRLCENSDIELSRRTFVSITLNKKRTTLAGTVERRKERKQFCILRACTFSHSLGQKAKYSLRADVFRFAPDSRLKSDLAGGPFGAKLGSRCSHSITSSARASNVGGTLR